MTKGGCYADDDLVAVVNATAGLAIAGLQLPITRQELNDTFGPRTPSITTSMPALGVYRFGHKIGKEQRCEYCFFPEGAQRISAAFEYGSNSPPFEGTSIFTVSLQPPRATKRAPQREAGESGLTPAGKATRSKPTEAELLATIEERDKIIVERDKTIAENVYEVVLRRYAWYSGRLQKLFDPDFKRACDEPSIATALFRDDDSSDSEEEYTPNSESDDEDDSSDDDVDDDDDAET